MTAGGNSGIQYRGLSRPDLGLDIVTGYQCDVVANNPNYNGMLYEEKGRRILSHTGEKVIIDPDEETLASYHQRLLQKESLSKRLAELRDLPAETTDGSAFHSRLGKRVAVFLGFQAAKGRLDENMGNVTVYLLMAFYCILSLFHKEYIGK